MRTLLLALGSNVVGRWGTPRETLRRARVELELAGIRTIRASNLYCTKPLAVGRQPRYLNAVLLAQSGMAPGHLLRLLKRIERHAGRKTTRAMAPRPLDIDILDYGGRCFGGLARRRECGRLILPHPELHKRAFVLVPLLDVAPGWCHPVLGLRAKMLLSRLTPATRAGVSQALDSLANTCDKQPR